MTAPALKKELSALQLFTLGFGSIIGVGWIILVGTWLTAAGSLGTVIAFMVGGFAMCLIGLCYCEASSLFPVTGGEVAYCYAFFGLRTAFAAGWIVVLAFTVGTAFEAIAVGWLLSVLIPGFSGQVIYSLWGSDIHLGSLLIGLGGMALIAAVNWVGVKTTSFVQDAITYGLIIFTLICIGVAFWVGDVANLEPLFVWDKAGSVMPGIFAVLAMVPLFYSGFNVIPQALGEKAEGVTAGQVSAAIAGSILGALVFYILVTVMTAIVMPRHGLLQYEMPAYGAISVAFGSTTAGKMILIAGLLGLISSWNAIFYAATRVLLVLARIHTIPVSFAELHPNFETPTKAILLVAIIGALATFLGQGALVPMVNALGTAMSLVFAAISSGVLISRIKHPDLHRPFRIPGPNIVPCIAGIISICLFSVGFYQAYAPGQYFPPPEWLLLLVWLGLGLLLWFSSKPTSAKISEAERWNILLPGIAKPAGYRGPQIND